MRLDRRAFLGSGLALAGIGAASAKPPGALYESLRKPGRIELPEAARAQQFFDSPAPKAEKPGRWIARAALPFPRGEVGAACEWNRRLHVVGGYGQQKFDRDNHDIYDPTTDSWSTGTPLPRGANNVSLAVLDGRLLAIGGFLDQNRRPHAECFMLDSPTGAWQPIAPLPRARGAVAVVAQGSLLHAIGGAVGDSFDARRSVDWHRAYDPSVDRWERRADLPTSRDHMAVLAVGAAIHVIGGRVDLLHTNSNLHHVYDPSGDRWEMRKPLPTARSGHAAHAIRGRIHVIGGVGTGRVFGVNEGYDIAKDDWQRFAPMPVPRHGFAAAPLGGAIHAAGGGAAMGGSLISAGHEAFIPD